MNEKNINNDDELSTTEELIYIVGIPNTGRDYTYAVTIEKNVLESYRYAEIERIVTGTTHVTVCDPQHYIGPVDENVYISVNPNGKIIITTN